MKLEKFLIDLSLVVYSWIISQARVVGSPSGDTTDFKGTSSRNASAIRLSTLNTQTPTGMKDRLLQKCQQELEVWLSRNLHSVYWY